VLVIVQLSRNEIVTANALHLQKDKKKLSLRKISYNLRTYVTGSLYNFQSVICTLYVDHLFMVSNETL
jgi:hypothetical protein